MQNIREVDTHVKNMASAAKTVRDNFASMASSVKDIKSALDSVNSTKALENTFDEKKLTAFLDKYLGVVRGMQDGAGKIEDSMNRVKESMKVQPVDMASNIEIDHLNREIMQVKKAWQSLWEEIRPRFAEAEMSGFGIDMETAKSIEKMDLLKAKTRELLELREKGLGQKVNRDDEREFAAWREVQKIQERLIASANMPQTTLQELNMKWKTYRDIIADIDKLTSKGNPFLSQRKEGYLKDGNDALNGITGPLVNRDDIVKYFRQLTEVRDEWVGKLPSEKYQRKMEEAFSLPESTVADTKRKLSAIRAAKEGMVELARKGDILVKQEDIQKLESAERKIIAIQNLLKDTEAAKGFGDNMAKAMALPESTVQETSAKINRIKKVRDEMIDAQKNGNTLIPQSAITDADNKVNQLLALKDRLQKEPIDKRLRWDFEQMIKLPNSIVTETQSKINKLTSLLNKMKSEKELKGNTLITDDDIRKVEDAITALRTLREEQRQNNAAQKVKDAMDKASSLPQGNIDEVNRKLRDINRVLAEMEAKRKSGNTFINPQDIANAKKLRQQLEQSRITMLGFDNAARGITNSLSNLFSLDLVSRFAKQMVAVRGEFELQEKTLAAIIQDETRASSMFNEISKQAVKSPFSVLSITKQTKQLAAYRIETEKLMSTTKMLGDISAGVGVDMNRLILAYGQVKAAGFLKGTELRQFSEAGVNMLGGLSERFTEIYKRSVSVGEVLQMISKKMVKFSDVEAVLQGMTQAGGVFYNMQEKQAETVKGQMTNLKDMWDITMNQMGQSTEGITKWVLNALRAIISNWKVTSTVITGGLALIIAYTIKIIAHAGELSRHLKGVLAVINPIGMGWRGWLPIIVAVAAAVISLGFALTKTNREIRSTIKEANQEAEDMTRRFKELSSVINDVAASERTRAKALEDLKSEYGSIINLQGVELNNLDKLNASRENNISLIKATMAEQARTKAMAKAVEGLQDSENTRGGRIRRAADVVGSTWLRDQFAEMNLYRSSMIDAIRKDIENEILDKTIKNEVEAEAELWKRLGLAVGMSADKAQEFASAVEEAKPVGDIIQKQFKRVFNTLEVIDETFSNTWDTTFSAKNIEFKRQIDDIEKRVDDFKREHAKEYENNPALLDQEADKMLEDEISAMRGKIAKALASGDLDSIDVTPLDKLLTNLSKKSKTGIDKMIRDLQAEINGKYKNLLTPIGTGILVMEDGDDLKAYKKKLEDAEKMYAGHLATLSAMNGAMTPAIAEAIQAAGLDPTEGGAAGKAVTIFKDMIAAINEALKGIGTVGNVTDANRKSALKSFVSDVKSAIKEIGNLDSEGQRLLRRKLELSAKEFGISIPLNLTEEGFQSWYQSIKKRLGEENYIALDLEINKESTKKFVESIKKNVSDLWDQYDLAKKFAEWGINMQGLDTAGILNEIAIEEKRLRDENTEESIAAADEIKKRRVQNARSEQEEAAKIMYEAQKKSLDKVEQAYRTMYENTAKIRKQANNPDSDYTISQAQVDAGVRAQMNKSLKEAADAQWELYQSTEMYAMAFGDLKNVGPDVLDTLIDQLNMFAKSGSISGRELRTVTNQIAKLEQMKAGLESGKSLVSLIAGSFKDISQAKAFFDEAHRMLAMVTMSNDDYTAALMKENELRASGVATEEELREAHLRTNLTQEIAAGYMDKYNETIKKGNALLDGSKSKMDKLKSAYGEIIAPISDAINFTKEFAAGLGLTFNEETEAALDGFAKGLTLVATGLGVVASTLTAVKAINEALGAEAAVTMATLTPLLAIAGALALTFAAIQASDKAKQRRVEDLKEEVDALGKAYDKLGDSMEKIIANKDLVNTMSEQMENIRQQREKLNEAISWENKRGGKKDENNIKDMTEQLEELNEKEQETRDSFRETLGATNNYQDVAKDWASSWLDAFKSGESGLKALGESFDKFYEDLVVGQLFSTDIMANYMTDLQQAVNDALTDGIIDDQEAEYIRSFKKKLEGVYMEFTDRAEEMGVQRGSSSSGGLQKGSKEVSEDTAQSIEGYLNSMRFFVADSNGILNRIERILRGSDGEGGNPMLNELRTQTRLLSRLAGAVSPNGQSLSVVIK